MLILCLAASFAAPRSAPAENEGPLPDGPGVNLVYAKCQQCHPINYVVESAGLPDFLWQDTLDLMKQLGMQVSEAEEEKLYEYLTTYLGTEPPPEPEKDAAVAAEVDGAEVYAGSCAVCHGAEGQGAADSFPPLAGHAAALAAADRDYLPLVVLFGLAGEIDVEGETYNGVMPPWGQLSNHEIAAVLNSIITGWGPLETKEFTSYKADEIEAARALGLAGAEVRDRRPALP